MTGIRREQTLRHQATAVAAAVRWGQMAIHSLSAVGTPVAWPV